MCSGGGRGRKQWGLDKPSQDLPESFGQALGLCSVARHSGSVTFLRIWRRPSQAFYGSFRWLLQGHRAPDATQSPWSKSDILKGGQGILGIGGARSRADYRGL